MLLRLECRRLLRRSQQVILQMACDAFHEGSVGEVLSLHLFRRGCVLHSLDRHGSRAQEQTLYLPVRLKRGGCHEVGLPLTIDV